MNSKASAARQYAERGWHVFPVKPDSKEPWTTRGFYDATSFTPSVERIWSAFPDANPAIRTGVESGLVVVDVDVKDGRDGRGSVVELGLTETLISRTPSGGFHYYYHHPGGRVPCRVGLRPGIDLRGDGGYVLGVGSIIDGQGYDWVYEYDLAPLPVRALTRPERDAFSFDREIPRGRRNSGLTRFAGMLINAGCGEDELFAALKVRNARYCLPSLPESEVRQISQSASRSFEPHPEMVENGIVDIRRQRNMRT